MENSTMLSLSDKLSWPKYLQLIEKYPETITKIAKNPNDPTIEKSSQAIQKVLHRESKEYNNSIFQKSIDRHKKNLNFFSDIAAKNNEIFTNYVNFLNSKPINQIERYEIEPLVSMLKLQTNRKQSTHLVDELIKRIIEREKLAASHSYFPSSLSRHEINLDYLENWMINNDVSGSTIYIKFDEYTKKVDKLCESLSSKVVDEITDTEVAELLNFLEKEYSLYNKIFAGKVRKIRENPDKKIEGYEETKSKAWGSMRDQYPLTKRQSEARQVAYTKILLREEMALSQSYLQSSKERHQKIIDFLKSNKPPTE